VAACVVALESRIQGNIGIGIGISVSISDKLAALRRGCHVTQANRQATTCECQKGQAKTSKQTATADGIGMMTRGAVHQTNKRISRLTLSTV
jgi:hypothetical protein